MQQFTRRTFLWGVAAAAAAVLAGCSSTGQQNLPGQLVPELPTEETPVFVPQTRTLTLAEGKSLTITVTGFSVGMDHRAAVSLTVRNDLGQAVTVSDASGSGVLAVSGSVDGGSVQALSGGLMSQTIPAGSAKQGAIAFSLPASFTSASLFLSLQMDGQTCSAQFNF